MVTYPLKSPTKNGWFEFVLTPTCSQFFLKKNRIRLFLAQHQSRSQRVRNSWKGLLSLFACVAAVTDYVLNERSPWVLFIRIQTVRILMPTKVCYKSLYCMHIYVYDGIKVHIFSLKLAHLIIQITTTTAAPRKTSHENRIRVILHCFAVVPIGLVCLT